MVFEDIGESFIRDFLLVGFHCRTAAAVCPRGFGERPDDADFSVCVLHGQDAVVLKQDDGFARDFPCDFMVCVQIDGAEPLNRLHFSVKVK